MADGRDEGLDPADDSPERDRLSEGAVELDDVGLEALPVPVGDMDVMGASLV